MKTFKKQEKSKDKERQNELQNGINWNLRGKITKIKRMVIKRKSGNQNEEHEDMKAEGKR